MTLPYSKWKINRTIISHTFSTTNLKRISYIFEDSSNSLINKIDSIIKNEESVDFPKLISYSTLDVLLKSFFGINIDSDNQSNKLLMEHISKLLSTEFTLLEVLSVLYPKISKITGNRFVDENTSRFFMDLMKGIIEERKRSSSHTKDLLPYLVNAVYEENNEDIKRCKNLHFSSYYCL